MLSYIKFIPQFFSGIFKKKKKKVSFFDLESKVKQIAEQYGYNYTSISVTSIKYTSTNYKQEATYSEELKFNLYASEFGTGSNNNNSVQFHHADPDMALYEFERLCKQKKKIENTTVSDVIV